MAHHQPARCTGEAPVGDEHDRLAEAGADDRRRDAQQLPHSRAAGRAFVAHDEHVTRRDTARADSVAARLFAVEDARRPAMRAPVRR